MLHQQGNLRREIRGGFNIHKTKYFVTSVITEFFLSQFSPQISLLACFKQADYLLLYEQNWLKEGTEALVLKITAASSKEKPIPN